MTLTRLDSTTLSIGIKTDAEERYAPYAGVLRQLEAESRRRQIPQSGLDGLVDLVSNDYMGLSTSGSPVPFDFTGLPSHLICRFSELQEKFNIAEASQWSSSASRLLSFRQEIPLLLEEILEADYGKPALLFNSGYHANTGAIGALNLPGTVFLTDKLMHASAYDALFSCRAVFERYPHNDVRKLIRLIEKHSSAERIVVVTESVFSMDGDMAPLKELALLRDRYPNMLLYVDEAHAYGCFGNHGLGLTEHLGLTDHTDIIIGTFGKAGASAGAFAIAPRILKDMMINRARSFIFSTALPPAVYMRSLQNHLRLRGATLEREKLQDLSKRVNQHVSEHFDKNPSQSHIIPLITGNADEAIRLARRLKEAGFLALPIRRPTVPPGQERVRLSLSASLSENTVDSLCNFVFSKD